MHQAVRIEFVTLITLIASFLPWQHKSPNHPFPLPFFNFKIVYINCEKVKCHIFDVLSCVVVRLELNCGGL